MVAVLAACARAGDTNHLLLDSSALAAMGAGNVGGVLPAVGAPTNQPPWSGALAAGLTLTGGNSESVLASTTIKVQRNNPTNQWTFGGDAAYGENDAVENTEILHGYGQYDHLFTQRWFGYGSADALHDGIADVGYRVTVSPGAGYYFIKTKQTVLAGETGPGAIAERLDSEQNYYMTARVAERLDQKIDDTRTFGTTWKFCPRWTGPIISSSTPRWGWKPPLPKKSVCERCCRTILPMNLRRATRTMTCDWLAGWATNFDFERRQPRLMTVLLGAGVPAPFLPRKPIQGESRSNFHEPSDWRV